MSEEQIIASAREQAAKFPGSDKPGSFFEVRSVANDPEWSKPDPSKSIKLPPNRQALVDDIIALYSCQPTRRRVERYTADCVYDDQFVYANDRYKMAGQWYALPKGFDDSTNHGYQENGLPKTARINALVSLSLDPDTAESDFIQVKYHKDQANEKDYSHKGLGFEFKKWQVRFVEDGKDATFKLEQADNVSKYMDNEDVKAFLPDKDAGKGNVPVYKDGKSSEVVGEKKP